MSTIDQFTLQVTLTDSRKWWSTDAGILYGHREVRAQVFPIGIEPSEFHLRLQKPCVQDAVINMRDGFNGCKVILGVDRLDCIKGIPQKLHAFDALLEQHPELVGNVVLLQVTIPSRDGLKAYQDLKEEIQQLVGKINGKYGMSFYTIIKLMEWARLRVYNLWASNNLSIEDMSSCTLFLNFRGKCLTFFQARSITYPYTSCTLASAPKSSQPYTRPPMFVSFQASKMV